MKIYKIIKTAQKYESQLAHQEHQQINDFIANSQNYDPDNSSFAIDLRQNGRAIPQNKRSNIAIILSQLGRKYHEQVPLNEIFDVLKQNNVIPLQEDGTKWAGWITSQGECGSDQCNNQPPISIDLAIKINLEYYLANSKLIMTICTMPSGKLELVAYLS